ncbi:hypothetical protein ANCCAN_00282 [Ancylostoma caninum]|uniref:Uncharacterized protein n=1 Tax=Ancylostoma caninum TaxID=29170 RepID=A0A368HDM7_ANCCA|nr:hypothetical protein ANCCAN_00282 [Ancylostoma caninum]
MEQAGVKQQEDGAPAEEAPAPKTKRSVGLQGAFFEPGYARCLCGKSSSELEELSSEKSDSTDKTSKPFSLDDEMVEWEEESDYYMETTTGLNLMEECKSERTKLDEPTGYDDHCICAFDRNTHDAWPCFLKDTWESTECDTCNEHAFCTKDNKTYLDKRLSDVSAI